MPPPRTNGCVSASRTAPAVEGPASLFVKLASEDAAHREMIGASTMGEREARFYVDVAPAVDLRVPRAYYAASADDGSFALLLEDLAAGGCAFSDGSWGVTADAAATALEEMARFHASFEDPAVRAAVAPWLATPQPQHGDFVAQLMRTVLDEHADVVTPAYIAAGELYIEHHARLTALWDSRPSDLHSRRSPTSATCSSTVAVSVSSTGVCRG